ncbi:MAG: HAMP domain-containing histidine kinase [Candidatus Riflebacteria bacterium]|nr:HAMP domain-containing histidine kinase [Candidatus Riflebacteria bacterium]
MFEKRNLQRSLFFRIFLLFCMGAGVSLLIAGIAGRILYSTEERPRSLVQKYVLGVNSFLLQEIPTQASQEELRQFGVRHPELELAVWKNKTLLFSSLNDPIDPNSFDDHSFSLDSSVKLLHAGHRLYAMSQKDGLNIILSHDLHPQKLVIAKTFLVLILMTMAVFWVVYRFVAKQLAPIRDLQKGTQEISLGNYHFRLQDAPLKEFEDLVHSFNSMADKLETTFVNNTLMIGNLSHDLKAYITRLRMTTEVEIHDQNVKKSLTEDIQALTHYLDNTLDAFRISSNKASFHFESVSCIELLKEILERQQSLYQGKPVAVDFPPAPLFVKLDQHFFRILLVNLLDNASTYGKNIHVSLLTNEYQFILEVKNTTLFSIDPSDLLFLSQPFFRPEKARKVSSGHSGLGLYIARQIAEAHHFLFSIECQSENFSVRIQGPIDHPD